MSFATLNITHTSQWLRGSRTAEVVFIDSTGQGPQARVFSFMDLT